MPARVAPLARPHTAGSDGAIACGGAPVFESSASCGCGAAAAGGNSVVVGPSPRHDECAGVARGAGGRNSCECVSTAGAKPLLDAGRFLLQLAVLAES